MIIDILLVSQMGVFFNLLMYLFFYLGVLGMFKKNKKRDKRGIFFDVQISRIKEKIYHV